MRLSPPAPTAPFRPSPNQRTRSQRQSSGVHADALPSPRPGTRFRAAPAPGLPATSAAHGGASRVWPRHGSACLAGQCAHMNDDVTPDLALILLQESRKTVLNLSVVHRPVGIGRALRRLPPKVLAAEIYRKLVDLLDDPVPAKFLHHTGSITDLLITSIHRLPADLRTAAIMPMFNQIDDMIWFVDGLRFLASRTGLP